MSDIFDHEGDAWEHAFAGEQDSPRNQLHSKCRYCQAGALLWKKLDGKWRLHTAEGAAHVCKPYHNLTAALAKSREIKKALK